MLKSLVSINVVKLALPVPVNGFALGQAKVRNKGGKNFYLGSSACPISNDIALCSLNHKRSMRVRKIFEYLSDFHEIQFAGSETVSSLLNRGTEYNLLTSSVPAIATKYSVLVFEKIRRD
jgi:hypothetical protein